MSGSPDLDSRLFGTEEMYAADAAAVEAGIPGMQLMESAGRAVAEQVRLLYTRGPTLVLCGPGNNGGDGFVVARLLQEAGWSVEVALLGDTSALKGDAALAAAKWLSPVYKLGPNAVSGHTLVVDALFGSGLTRPIKGVVRQTLEKAVEAKIQIVAIDLPSGIDGDTGAALGYAAKAAHCITFRPKKTGHCLLPGRTYCGDIHVESIGTPEHVLAGIRSRCWENHPVLWQSAMRWPGPESNKYTRGVALVVGGGSETTGAARLAARAALRAGAGIVTVACPRDALPTYAADLVAVMTKVVSGTEDLVTYAADRRRNAVLIGPGCGISDLTRRRTLGLLALGKPCVIDADALSVFAEVPSLLFHALNENCVLTPHDGEFVRLFPKVGGSRLERARGAAIASGAVVLLKGGDTVVAAPDGRATITTNAPPDLATAGTGDVLAGIVVGLLAQGMGAYDAANAAAWIHADTARRFGPGLIAEDLPDEIPQTYRNLIK